MPDAKGEEGKEMTDHLTAPFETKQVESSDPDWIRFSGMASTFGNVDLGGDVIERGAFTDSLQRMHAKGQKLPILWSHRADVPLGVFEKAIETDDGLFVEGVMPKSDTFVSGRIAPQLIGERASIKGMSIGFTIDEKRSEGNVRYLEKVSLVETSLVVFPMNPEAGVSQAKALGHNRLTKDDLEGLDGLTLRDLEGLLCQPHEMSKSVAKMVAGFLFEQRDAARTAQKSASRDDSAASEGELAEVLRRISIHF